MEIDPSQLDLKLRYKLLIGGIVPRPIAWVSTSSVEGVDNLAPFSFFNGVGSDPMSLLVCPSNAPDGSEKDTLRNAKPVDEGGRGEFVVNVVPDALAELMAASAEALPADESEFDLTGLEKAKSHRVAPPRVARSPLQFECETRQVIRLNPGAPGGGNILIGEVVHVHVDDALIDERMRIDPVALDAVGRMGGHGYTRTRERFEIRAGRSALEEGRR